MSHVELHHGGEVIMRLKLGSGPAIPTDGYGGWTEIARPDDTPITEWEGTPGLRMSVPILFDGFRENRSIQAELDRLLTLGRNGDEQPDFFRLTGPVPYSGERWVIENFEFGDVLRSTDGRLVRQRLVMNLLEFEASDQIKLKRRRPRKRFYRTKRGDTLVKIAKKLYDRNEIKRAKAIGKANKIRDIRRKLKPGKRLVIP